MAGNGFSDAEQRLALKMGLLPFSNRLGGIRDLYRVFRGQPTSYGRDRGSSRGPTGSIPANPVRMPAQKDRSVSRRNVRRLMSGSFHPEAGAYGEHRDPYDALSMDPRTKENVRAIRMILLGR